MKNCTCSKCVLLLCFRVSLGISIALVGLSHYANIQAFTGMVTGSLGVLSSVAVIWAYILPALQIIGGLWFAVNASSKYAAYLLGIAFASIAIGMLIKPLLGTACLAGCEVEVMPLAQNALLWLFFLVAAVGFVCNCNKR